MKDRSRAEITADLKAVRVPLDVAEKVAEAAGLSGIPARRFARDNLWIINFTASRESDLLLEVIGQYEAKVKRAMRIALHQQEYNALMSYAYNPGGGWIKTTRLVNEGRHHNAMVEIKCHVHSKGGLVRSLFRRREAKSGIFLYEGYD